MKTALLIVLDWLAIAMSRPATPAQTQQFESAALTATANDAALMQICDRPARLQCCY